MQNAVKSNYLDVIPEAGDVSVLNDIFNHSAYKTASWTKEFLNKWMNDMPGAPSILMVFIESYSSFLVREAMANGATKGYHIRFMMVIMHGFGFFSDDGKLKESDILKILRSNDTVRNAAKVSVLDSSLELASNAVENRQKTLAEVEAKIAKASPGEKVILHGVKNRLEGSLKDEIKDVSNLQDEIDDKIERQYLREKGRIEGYQSKRKANNAQHVDEFYNQAEGRRARVYKSVIWGVTVVGLVEDWAKLVRANSDPAMPKVDMDIVLANYAKTITDSAVACSSAIVLMNRWVSSERQLFPNNVLFQNGGKAFADHADRLAVVGSIISIYISSRDLYETYNSKTLLEKTDKYLDIAANTITTVGYLVVKGAFDKMVSPLVAMYLLPGLGQLLLVAGMLVTFVQIGIYAFQLWQGYRFKRDAAVGYYFWEEFESVREKGQRYISNDENLMACYPEIEAYKELMDIYENNDLLGKNNSGEGWGHLSWRGAVPFFVSWRQMGMSESQLLSIIENLSKVPELEGQPESTSKAPLTKEITVKRLLSPEAIVKFYLHLEEVLKRNPKKEIYFDKGDTKLTYRGVMNLLERGEYQPKGETDDVLHHLKGIDDIKTLNSSSFTILQLRYKNVVWDHEHFSK